MLSIVFDCSKFHCYVLGTTVTVFNDHKPLEQIFKKPLLSAPMRLQRMLLNLQWYDLNVVYRAGKHMNLPDTLSRAHLPDQAPEIPQLYAVKSIDFLSVSKEKHEEIKKKTQEELTPLKDTILKGWPDSKTNVEPVAKPFWDSRAELTVSDGVIYKGMRIVIPPSLQGYMLKLIHESHMGIVKCKQRGREVMYWPAMNAEIEETVKNCPKCATFQKQNTAEPLIPTKVPDFPFAEVSTDIFEFEGKNYLILVDYYSKYIEVDELKNLTSTCVIDKLKSQFSRHGIPEKLRSDCGSQFTSRDFALFCHEYGIEHTKSSPYFHSSNGEAERGVQTVKRLWQKNPDRHLALLDYRTTPLEGVGLSPAQLLMGRRPRNKLPICRNLLNPSVQDKEITKKCLNKLKEKQKLYHDRPHLNNHTPFQLGDEVRMTPLPGSKEWQPAVVVSQGPTPRSYVVQSRGQHYRRNRKQLKTSTRLANTETWTPGVYEEISDEIPSTSTYNHPHNGQKELYKTRSGREVHAPERLDL